MLLVLEVALNAFDKIILGILCLYFIIEFICIYIIYCNVHYTLNFKLLIL